MPQIDDISDLLNATLEELGEGKITDLATTLQRFPGATEVLANKVVKVQGGTSCRFNVITEGDGNAQWTNMFAVNNLDHVDGTTYGDVPWRGTKTGMTVDEDEIAVNTGPRQLLDFVKLKRYQRDIDLINLYEAGVWGGPSSSSDTLTMFGLLKYWLDYDSGTTVAFNGANHTNFSSGPAGLSCSTYTNWRHAAAAYTAVTDADLIAKIRDAIRLANFMGIPNAPIGSYAKGPVSWQIYTTADVIKEMENLCRANNESLGNDLARYQDSVVINRVPVAWVPYLQNNHSTSDPVIGVNWNVVEVVGLQGRWMVEQPFHLSARQNTVRESYVDSRFNMICRDRRNGLFLLAKSDPMSD